MKKSLQQHAVGPGEKNMADDGPGIIEELPVKKKILFSSLPVSVSPGEESSSPITIVNAEYPIKNLNLSPAFIAEHARRMGSFGRPRRFILSNVIRHIEEAARQSMERGGVRIGKSRPRFTLARVAELERD